MVDIDQLRAQPVPVKFPLEVLAGKIIITSTEVGLPKKAILIV